jgi:hypothetical protein
MKTISILAKACLALFVILFALIVVLFVKF